MSYLTARKFADEKDIPVVEVCGREGVNVVGEVIHLS